MTSKIVVNNIESDTGISSVTFTSNITGEDSTQNISGINSITANTFYGDGSGLTGAGPTLSSGSNDRVITATGANALLGEANLTFSGSVLNINGTSDDTPLMIDTANNNGAHLRFRKDGSNQHFVGSGGGFGLGDKEDLSFRAYDNLLFSTGNSSTERLRIKSDGKVNITPGGALSGSHPPGDLNIVGTNFLTMTPNDNANASDNEVLGVIAFLPYAAGSIAAASAKIEAVAESGQSGSSNATSLRFYNKNSSTGPGNSGIERMRLTSNANGTGALYINQTSEVSGANSHLVVNNSVAIVSGSTFRSFYMSGNGNAYFWNGSNQPYISSGGSFTNASDVSLKKDITDLTYGIDVLKNLKPRKYKMKADDKEQIGFIAQEVEADVPEVVEASETPNGDQHKGLAYGNLTAVLTKALQEAVTKIEKLEAEVNNLKGS